MITPFPYDQAVTLSTEAGWNQTLNDWRRVGRLASGGMYGIEREGRLVSSATAVVYDKKLAWIGMVLTSPEWRGQGFAGTLMKQALRDIDAREVSCTKLDATELGRPVYSKLGFIDERPVSRLLRSPAPAPFAQPLESAAPDLSIDGEAFGADRTGLLQSLAGEETYAIPGSGFAFARPGRIAWHFGPCVARDAATARRLLAAFLHKHSGDASILDLCDEHEEAVRMATEAGYQPVRRLMRMLRGDTSSAPLATGPMIWYLAGFEYG